MICGGISGLFAQSLTYPFEVTRRRMQTLKVLCHANNNETAINVVSKSGTVVEKDIATTSTTTTTSTREMTKSPSMLRIMKEVFQEQGTHGFFKGLSMNWLKGPVSFAISFTTFDLIKEFIDAEEVRWNEKKYKVL
jgi:Mitochondrial carrier protein.